MIDIKKQYKTKNGHKVRIYATDSNDTYPIHGAVFIDGVWKVTTWTVKGCYDVNGTTDNLDLIEIKPIQDKDPVYAWDDDWTHIKVAGFYDAKNKRLFHRCGTSNGNIYNNYELIENPPQWMIEAQKTLKD